jgi:hypothetical protein
VFAAITTECAAAEATVLPGTGLVDIEYPSVEFFSIKSGDGPLSFIVATHFDESKSPGLSGVTIGNDTYALNGSVLLKQRSNGAFGCPEAEIRYENILHVVSFVNLQNGESGQDRTNTVETGRWNCLISGLSNYV